MRRLGILKIYVTARWAVCKLMTARGSSIDPFHARTLICREGINYSN
jgi:hypothetical protein